MCASGWASVQLTSKTEIRKHVVSGGFHCDLLLHGPPRCAVRWVMFAFYCMSQQFILWDPAHSCKHTECKVMSCFTFTVQLVQFGLITQLMTVCVSEHFVLQAMALRLSVGNRWHPTRCHTWLICRAILKSVEGHWSVHHGSWLLPTVKSKRTPIFHLSF